MYPIALTATHPQELRPGAVRVIYDDSNGQLMGLVAHENKKDRNFCLAKDYRARWYYREGFEHPVKGQIPGEWVYRAPSGDVVHFQLSSF